MSLFVSANIILLLHHETWLFPFLVKRCGRSLTMSWPTLQPACMRSSSKNANTGEPGRQWLYRCKCPKFHITAYICFHVLVALTLDRDVDFDAIQHADAVYTDKVGSGRKPKDAKPKIYSVRVTDHSDLVQPATPISVGESIECGRPDSRS